MTRTWSKIRQPKMPNRSGGAKLNMSFGRQDFCRKRLWIMTTTTTPTVKPATAKPDKSTPHAVKCVKEQQAGL